MGRYCVKNLVKSICFACFWPASVWAQDVSLNVTGNADMLAGPLRSASLTLALVEETPDAQDIVAAARADYRRILTALYAAGHYAGTISIQLDGREASSIAPLNAPNRVNHVSISVDTGPAFTIGSASIAPLPTGITLPEELNAGAAALSDSIRAGVVAGVDAWRNQGHAKARPVSQDISADHRNNTLNVDVGLDVGPRLTFGELAVTGNSAIRERAIRRIAGLPTGSVYSPDELKKAAGRLRRIAAISSAALIEAEDIGPNDTLPITAQIGEAKPRRIGFGLELSSLEGLTVSTFWMHRNAFGGAEKFRADAEVSGIGGATGGVDYILGASLDIPAIYGPDTDLRARFEISREDEPEYLTDKISFQLEATRVLGDNLTATVGFGILTAREEVDGSTRRYSLLTLPLGLEYDRRDNTTDAKSGYYIDIEATPFIGLQGSEDGARIYADARIYRSFGENDRFTIAARGQIGSVVGASTLKAPADFLFYSGGGGTVRGQPYHALSIPQGGFSTGGTSFIGAQVEARVGIRDNIDLVGFYDFGQIGEDVLPRSTDSMHAGYGVGVRYKTGIGPIRLDLGLPVDEPIAFNNLQLYIGIGQAF